MPELGTSGLTSGDGKRGDGQRAPSYRAHPRLYLNGHSEGQKLERMSARNDGPQFPRARAAFFVRTILNNEQY